MPYTIEDYQRDFAIQYLDRVPVEERLKGINPDDRLKGLKPEERLKGLPLEERLSGFSADEVEAYARKLREQQMKTPVASKPQRKPSRRK